GPGGFAAELARVHDRDGEPAPREHVSRGEPDRAGSDDDDVVAVAHTLKLSDGAFASAREVAGDLSNRALVQLDRLPPPTGAGTPASTDRGARPFAPAFREARTS